MCSPRKIFFYNFPGSQPFRAMALPLMVPDRRRLHEEFSYHQEWQWHSSAALHPSKECKQCTLWSSLNLICFCLLVSVHLLTLGCLFLQMRKVFAHQDYIIKIGHLYLRKDIFMLPAQKDLKQCLKVSKALLPPSQPQLPKGTTTNLCNWHFIFKHIY